MVFGVFIRILNFSLFSSASQFSSVQTETQSEKTRPTCCSVIKSLRITEHLSCLGLTALSAKKDSNRERDWYHNLVQKWLSWLHWWQSSLEQRASEQLSKLESCFPVWCCLASLCSHFQSSLSISVPVIFGVCGNFETQFVKSQPATCLLLHSSTYHNTA